MVVLLALTACTEYSSVDAPFPVVIDGNADPDALSIHVFPAQPTHPDGSPRAASAELRDPSFETDNRIDLGRPVWVDGTVMGTIVAPMARAELPSEPGPILADLSWRQPSAAVASIVGTDSEGLFSVALVPGEHRVTIAPDFPTTPMTTTRVDVTDAGDPVDFDLGEGLPIWGRVLLDDGRPYANAQVQLISREGLPGATAVTNDDGWYEIRATPDVYTLRAKGLGDGFDPVLTTAIEVGPQGARADFVYVDADLETIQARALGPGDVPLPFLPYRLRANTLLDYGTEARLEITGLTDSAGNIVTQAISGNYTLELLPVPGEDLSARRVADFDVESSPKFLGDVNLGALTLYKGQVFDPLGEAVADAQVRCTELGFSGRAWSAFTNPFGEFELEAAESALVCAITPPGGRDDMALTRIELMDEGRYTFLAGREITGTVQLEEDPEEFALIEVRDGTGRVWGSAVSDAGGRFSLRVEFPQ